MHAPDDEWVKRVTVQLEDELHKQVKVWAAQNDVSMNDLFVEAIRSYLEANAGPAEERDP